MLFSLFNLFRNKGDKPGPRATGAKAKPKPAKKSFRSSVGLETLEARDNPSTLFYWSPQNGSDSWAAGTNWIKDFPTVMGGGTYNAGRPDAAGEVAIFQGSPGNAKFDLDAGTYTLDKIELANYTDVIDINGRTVVLKGNDTTMTWTAVSDTDTRQDGFKLSEGSVLKLATGASDEQQSLVWRGGVSFVSATNHGSFIIEDNWTVSLDKAASSGGTRNAYANITVGGGAHAANMIFANTVDGSVNLLDTGSLTAVAGGTIEVRCGSSTTFVDVGASNPNYLHINGGTFVKNTDTGSATTTMPLKNSNSGTVEIKTGTLLSTPDNTSLYSYLQTGSDSVFKGWNQATYKGSQGFRVEAGNFGTMLRTVSDALVGEEKFTISLANGKNVVLNEYVFIGWNRGSGDWMTANLLVTCHDFGGTTDLVLGNLAETNVEMKMSNDGAAARFDQIEVRYGAYVFDAVNFYFDDYITEAFNYNNSFYFVKGKNTPSVGLDSISYDGPGTFTYDEDYSSGEYYFVAQLI